MGINYQKEDQEEEQASQPILEVDEDRQQHKKKQTTSQKRGAARESLGDEVNKRCPVASRSSKGLEVLISRSFQVLCHRKSLAVFGNH